ncbi:xanthine dehydrogenase family protein molybdopterin-binding subunit [Candidatus Poriferisocius sp.]|uniref:xanthine dehydrogenase family protein molybdopterin-binding subunit n=1 Tax=Candidatus Poriferisocius sp. TaxID=3101276 RepID=UPI003B01712A
MGFVGDSVARLEDPRLLRGAGRFVDDIDLPGQLWMRVVRSTHAHGRVTGIDASAAETMAGVRLVLTGVDVAHVEPIPLRLPFDGLGLEQALQPVLAQDRVRYVGEPIAIVLAEDPYVAEDAAEAVIVDIEPLDAVVDMLRAPIEQSLWPDSSNELCVLEKGYGDIGAAFEQAERVVTTEVAIGRHSGVPLETRGLVCDFDAGRDELTVWGATLVTHYHRKVLARLLGRPPASIHMRSTDAGGSFGVRGDFFPEDFLVAYGAVLTGRPVKWIEDRAENLTTTNHAREQTHHMRGAFDFEGRLLGLEAEVWHNKGAYIRPTGVIVSELTLGMIPGPYRLPAYASKIHVLTTNKTPVGPYRAPGRYELTVAREQLLDLAAAELDLDPVEIRRRNLLTASELPYEPGFELAGESFLLDSGDFIGLIDQAGAKYAEWRDDISHANGDRRGIGLSIFMDKSGLGFYETGAVDIDTTGAVRIFIGGASSGQGIETVMAQIAADELGVDPACIQVIHGDSDLVPDGVGSWSSRSTVIGGMAVQTAARHTADKAKRIAADLLEAAPDDLILADGRVHVAGAPSKSVTFGRVAEACGTLEAAQRGEDPGLGAREVHFDERMNYPYGAVIVDASLDSESGQVRLNRVWLGCEVGKAVNPKLVEGQVLGGFAQGLGGALLEEFAFDENGQPQAANFMDYLMPTAADLPPIETAILENAPTPTNPLGAKGAGEAGIAGAGGAIAAAVGHALGDPGAVGALPITPDWVLAQLVAQQEG